MALAAFSKGQQLNMLRSAALLCPIAYVGQITSPLARNAAENFVAEVSIDFFHLQFFYNFLQYRVVISIFINMNLVE